MKTKNKTGGLFATVAALMLAVDVSAANRVELRPSCDTISITYCNGGSVSVSVINLPYKVEIIRHYPGPVHPILSDIPGQAPVEWRHYNGGPRGDLEKGVNLAKENYSLELAAVTLANGLCRKSAWSSYVDARAECLVEKQFGTEEDYRQCRTDAITTYKKAIAKCKSSMARRLLRAITDCDAEITDFIETYQGCDEDELENHIRSWERYWAHLQ